MEMEPESLDKEDVIRVEGSLNGLGVTFLAEDLDEFLYRHTPSGFNQLFVNGVSCKVLRPGSTNWRSGTIYFQVRFLEDEPESPPEIEEAAESSPLDDIRRLEMGSES
ncbi:MAG: hypothetical protein Fur0042_28000 [Cyanophyceae cyanobacterium]